jgi:hypothetical protein
MQTVRTIGLDIANSVFQVHGVDADCQVLIRRQLRRRYSLRSCRGACRVDDPCTRLDSAHCNIHCSLP